MISDATDYRYVSFARGIEVDGDIMPKRSDLSGLRGVDVGFLLEAYEERSVACGAHSYAHHYDFDGSIRASRLSSIASGYGDLVKIQVSQRSGPFVKDVQLSNRKSSSSSPVTEFGMSFPASDLVSSAEAFAYGGKLVDEDVLNLFTDAQALRTFVLGGGAYSSVLKQWALSTTGDSGSVSGYSDGPGTNFIHVWRSEYSTGQSPGLKTGTKTPASGALRFVLPAADLVGECRLLIRAYVERAPATSIFADQEYCWIVVDAVRDGDAFSIGADGLSAAAAAAMAVTGLQHPPPPTASTIVNNASLTVYVSDVYAVCTLTDHTDQTEEQP